MRTARNLLATPQLHDDALLAIGPETQREAMRETALDCLRRERMARVEQMAARDLKFQPGSHGRDLSKGRDPTTVDPDRPSWMSAHDVHFRRIALQYTNPRAGATATTLAGCFDCAPQTPCDIAVEDSDVSGRFMCRNVRGRSLARLCANQTRQI